MTGYDEDTAAPAEAPHKPRLILMGEFSAGKSTLSNVLLGVPTLPMQITATRLPPVYVTYGQPGAYAITPDWQRVDFDPGELSHLPPGEFRSVHVTVPSDMLELCDLVDMPGISDPNMPADTWDDVAGIDDHVVWCTHATQAWRQSEAATWERMRGATSGQNLLLVTQYDKLRSPRDQARVMGRVRAEAGDKFAAIYPISLRAALEAGEDFAAWKASGAQEFVEHLIGILVGAPPEPAEAPTLAAAAAPAPAEVETDAGGFEILRPSFDKSAAPPEPPAEPAGPRVMPRRVQAKPGGSSLPRLPRSAKLPPELMMTDPGRSDMRIQDQLQDLLDARSELSLVAFGDLSSGLILNWCAKSACPREVLDLLGEKAAESFGLLDGERAAAGAKGADPVVIRFTERATQIFARDPATAEDVVCAVADAGAAIEPLLAQVQAVAQGIAGSS